MSVPFTISKDNYWQLDKMEELRLALSERYAFVMPTEGAAEYRSYSIVDGAYSWIKGNDSVDDTLGANEPLKGFNLQAYTFYNEQQIAIQDELVFLYAYPDSSYYDIDADIYDFVDFKIDVSFKSFLEFCKYCGGTLYTSDEDYGWRRVSEITDGEPVFSRGAAEIGDYLGGWLVEDLVLAYEHLKTAQFYPQTAPNAINARIYNKGSIETSATSIWFGFDSVYSTDYRTLVVDGEAISETVPSTTPMSISFVDRGNDESVVMVFDTVLSVFRGGVVTEYPSEERITALDYDILITHPEVEADEDGTFATDSVQISVVYTPVKLLLPGETGEPIVYPKETVTIMLDGYSSTQAAGYYCDVSTPNYLSETLFDRYIHSEQSEYIYSENTFVPATISENRLAEAIFTGCDIDTPSNVTFAKGELFTYFDRYEGTYAPTSFVSTILSEPQDENTGYVRAIAEEEVSAYQGFLEAEAEDDGYGLQRDWVFTLIPDFTNA